MESGKNWYVIHTYSGYEKKVRDNLERKVRSIGLENVIERILVPEEDEIDIKDGQKRTVRRKVFPGYVFVEMEVNDRSWYVVRNTPGVTGFVGYEARSPGTAGSAAHPFVSRHGKRSPSRNYRGNRRAGPHCFRTV